MSIHKVYAELNVRERDAVDDAWQAAADTLKRRGFRCSWDDRAERLVEAIAVYLKESEE